MGKSMLKATLLNQGRARLANGSKQQQLRSGWALRLQAQRRRLREFVLGRAAKASRQLAASVRLRNCSGNKRSAS
jgi:hypothetical protein